MAIKQFGDLTDQMKREWGRAYSMLKFGDDTVAKNFAYKMADAFFDNYTDLFTDDQPQPVIIPAPCSSNVPIASKMLADHFMHRLNAIMADRMLPPVEMTLMQRLNTYYNNYCHLEESERARLLAQDTLYINRDFIAGKRLIFVDDCTITGTHEKNIIRFFDAHDLNNELYFVCYANYTGADPTIEGRLNHLYIKSADDVLRQYWRMSLIGERFILTTRAVRLILEANEDAFRRFIHEFPQTFINELLHAAISKEYHLYEDYTNNFLYLKACCAKELTFPKQHVIV
jgi:hypothetical protein